MAKIKRRLFKYPFFFKEILLNYPNEKRNFRRRLGYDLCLHNPTSLNEKIVWKKLTDRNPLLTIVADKIKVRDYVRHILDLEFHRILIPLYLKTSDPILIDFDKLPKEYVVKANHGSGTNLIVEEGSKVKRHDIVNMCKDWLKDDYGFLNFEWAYQKIPRKILIEKLLRNNNGKLPDDYKLHVINGKWEFVHINHDKFDNYAPTLYDNQWKKLDVSYKGKVGPEVSRPLNFDQMVLIAERLAQYFDYIRVDLYLCDDQIFFGELTNYPASGSAKYSPLSFDFEIGAKYILSERYWERNGSLELYKKLV